MSRSGFFIIWFSYVFFIVIALVTGLAGAPCYFGQRSRVKRLKRRVAELEAELSALGAQAG